MLTWLRAQWRLWRVKNELYENKPERHPALAGLQVGELIPWKGTHWRVAFIKELPVPAVILVPVQETRASKVATLTRLRRADRILSKDEATVARSMARRADR